MESKDLQYPSSSYASNRRGPRLFPLLTDKGRKTLYIGVTNDVVRRLWQHRNPKQPSFSQQYHCILLVHFERFNDVNDAIAREKQLKGWRRAKKIALIKKENPQWEDLAGDWML